MTAVFSDFRLYVITDPILGLGRSHAEQAEAAARGGADMVQVRDKTLPPKLLEKSAKEAAGALAPFSRTRFVLNDWPLLAKDIGAQGLHVGQGDLSVSEARGLSPESFVGKSTHSLEQALEAEQEGPDYLALGPVYPTQTKRAGSPPVGLGVLEAVATRLKIPWVAIGGINLGNLSDVMNAGASRVAVVSAAVGALDIEGACREFSARIRTHGR